MSPSPPSPATPKTKWCCAARASASLARLTDQDHVIALCVDAKQYESPRLAARLDGLFTQGKAISPFVIRIFGPAPIGAQTRRRAHEHEPHDLSPPAGAGRCCWSSSSAWPRSTPRSAITSSRLSKTPFEIWRAAVLRMKSGFLVTFPISDWEKTSARSCGPAAAGELLRRADNRLSRIGSRRAAMIHEIVAQRAEGRAPGPARCAYAALHPSPAAAQNAACKQGRYQDIAQDDAGQAFFRREHKRAGRSSRCPSSGRRLRPCWRTDRPPSGSGARPGGLNPSLPPQALQRHTSAHRSR